MDSVAIEAVNVNYMGLAPAVKVPEGCTFASLDPVALDFLCARYCFKTVPIQ